MDKNSKSLKTDSSDYLTSLSNKSKNSTTLGKVENLWNAPDAVEYASKRLGIKLDDWQKKYIKTEGNTAVRAGRQSGKSYAESLRVALFALLHPKTLTLIISSVDRQSVELLEKVKSHIITLAPKNIKGKPIIHEIKLTNGSKIIAAPSGRTGYGLRGYAINKLVVDEAHYVPDEVFVAVRPMLATTGGTIDVLSTPRGNVGFFYDCFQDDNFHQFHVKSEDCPRITKDFLDKEKRRMTKLQYFQEYEAEFLDELQQFFSLKLINSCIGTPTDGTDRYMGVDVARYGGDENSFIVGALKVETLNIVDIETTERVSIANTIDKIQEKDKQWNFKKVYIDDGGIGGAVLDVLLEKDGIKRKIVGINNASRSVTADKKGGKKLLKEDLYGNLKQLMEQKLIILPENDRLIQSLLSIQFEYTDDRNLKIFGKYSHITEGLIRAAWCVKTKGLRLYVY